MVPSTLLLDFAIVLVAAEVGSVIFQRLGLSRVIGMLVAGIIIGPFVPGVQVNPQEVQDLALLGAVLLMFSIGLTFDLGNFKLLGWKPIVLATCGVLVSLVVGTILGLSIGWTPTASLMLGLVLTSTSSTIALRFMGDSQISNMRGADIVIAAILLDDIIALIAMTFIVASVGPASGGTILSIIFGVAVLLVLLALLIVVSNKAMPRVLKMTEIVSPGSISLVAVSFCLLIAFIFSVVGLPPLVGAFFGGSIVASTRFGTKVSKDLSSVTTIFTAVFFTSIGMLVDIRLLPGVLLIALLVVSVAIIAKFLPGILILRHYKVPPAESALTALSLTPRGEISLIVAEYAVGVGAPEELRAVAVTLVAVTALTLPILARIARKRYETAKESEATAVSSRKEVIEHETSGSH